MLEKIKSYFRKWFSSGIMLPMIYDPLSGKPSITLTCVYITFFTAIKCFYEYKNNPVTPLPTIISICFWALSMIFYLIRKIAKAKFDLDDKSLEIESEEDSEGDISNSK